MLRMNRAIVLLAVMVTALCLPSPGKAETVHLKFPAGGISQHDYFHELLDTALREAGYTPEITKVEDVPHLRVWEMLEFGDISVMWLVKSEERDSKYDPVDVPLTNGLIGKRILLVPPGSHQPYGNVQTLEDFRALGKVGAFGTNWFDTTVWRAHGLLYKEMAKPELIYGVVAEGDRGVDYFSRGFNEIIHEQKAHPEVAIEPHLMFEYERDFVFYVTRSRRDLIPILTKALTQARDSGLIDRLVKKHWAENFRILKPETRTVIRLQAPH